MVTVFYLWYYFSMDKLDSIEQIKQKWGKNKVVPVHLEEEFYNVIQYYPELENTYIVVIETIFYGTSNTLRAYPPLLTYFYKNKDRVYSIVINLNKKVPIPFYSLSKKDKEGMLAHELAHVSDYAKRTQFSLIWMGIHFLISKRYVREMEHSADRKVVEMGCGDLLLSYRKYLLEKSDYAHASYIRNMYLTPKEILDEMKKYPSLYKIDLYKIDLQYESLNLKIHKKSLLNRIKHMFKVILGFIPAIAEMMYLLHIKRIHRN